MTLLALVATALVIGGMVFYSFGFAAPVLVASRHSGRRAAAPGFSQFYLFVRFVSAVSALRLVPSDPVVSPLMGLVAASMIPTRQVLMRRQMTRPIAVIGTAYSSTARSLSPRC